MFLLESNVGISTSVKHFLGPFFIRKIPWHTDPALTVEAAGMLTEYHLAESAMSKHRLILAHVGLTQIDLAVRRTFLLLCSSGDGRTQRRALVSRPNRSPSGQH